MYRNIPEEMRTYPQWVLWRLEWRTDDIEHKLKPTKIPYQINGYRASVTERGHWATFEQVMAHAPAFLAQGVVSEPDASPKETGYSGIGFVLTKYDPYAIVDLDYTAVIEDRERQMKLGAALNSYTEFSPSGQGFHIITKAILPGPGRRRASIELYDAERFMTMTGNVYQAAPIMARQDIVSILYEELRTAPVIYNVGVDKPQTQDDTAIFNAAIKADNGLKFEQLWTGKWDEHYSSQSEADFALIDMLTFYTENRAQIVRMFRASALGQREKAERDNYVLPMVERSFDRQIPPVDVSGLAAQFLAKAEAKKRGEVGAAREPGGSPAAPALNAPSGATGAEHPPASHGPAMPSSVRAQFPPGLLGDIAEYIYLQAPRPVPVIALAGALALLAGITGRAYNVSNMGLSQYILLLADTGIGKEAMASGISKLMAAVTKGDENAALNKYIGPGEISSGPALIKWLTTQPCFLSIIGEFGLRLQQMTGRGAPAHEVSLRKMLLDVFGKSGAGQVLQPMAYADKDKNTIAINSPNLTLLGESTPGRFYEALDEAMVTEGLLPRFMIFEYTGERSRGNEDHANVKPSPKLVGHMRELIAICSQKEYVGQAQQVAFDEGALKLLKMNGVFDEYCNEQRKGSNSDVLKELWSRGHVKAMKLAALVAVGISPVYPTITEAVALWAMDWVTSETRRTILKFEKGEVGTGAMGGVSESAQTTAVIRVIKEYMSNPHVKYSTYGGSFKMHTDKVILADHIQRRLANTQTFRQDRFGPTNAIKKAIAGLIEADDIREVPKRQMSDTYGSAARAFVVSNPERFL